MGRGMGLLHLKVERSSCRASHDDMGVMIWHMLKAWKDYRNHTNVTAMELLGLQQNQKYLVRGDEGDDLHVIGTQHEELKSFTASCLAASENSNSVKPPSIPRQMASALGFRRSRSRMSLHAATKLGPQHCLFLFRGWCVRVRVRGPSLEFSSESRPVWSFCPSEATYAEK